MKKQSDPEGSELVLVLTPGGRDARLTTEILGRRGLATKVCPSIEDMCAHIADAACALVSEEVLNAAALACVEHALAEQPPWSDFPVLVFSAPGRSAAARAADVLLPKLGHVTFLDRPVQVRTMLAAVQAALRARRQQYQARRAIEMRDQFLAMLGHELRNPLGAIRLAVELSTRDDGGASWTRHRQVIERQATHLTRLVDDLLDVARVSYGKIKLQTAPLDLRDVVRATFESLEPSARAHKLTFTLKVPSSPLPVVGDRLRIEQVLQNLFTNAIKYTPPLGVVSVEASADAQHALVSVVDSGIGIEKHMLRRVFQLFAQAEVSLARSQGGMGVGLTVAQNLARLHGGDIAARSEGPGTGSEFVLRLPLRPFAKQTPTHPPPPQTAPARRIVLVEDNADIREMLAELLQAAGHEVTTAADGPAGVARIVAAAPDLALVDVGLPGFDGFEVARRVRDAGLRDVLLVAVTGYGQQEDRQRAEQAGFDAHLTKPVSMEQLDAVMRRGG